MGTDSQRELMAQVEELGYTLRGWKNGEAVMWHPDGGMLRIHASLSDHRAGKNIVSKAKRKIHTHGDAISRFVTHLMRKYEIPDDGIKELDLRLPDEAREFVEQNRESVRASSLASTLTNDPRVTVIRRAQGERVTRVRLTGVDYGLKETPHEETRVVTESFSDPSDGHQSPMDVILDQIRVMVSAEMSADVQEMQARIDLAADALREVRTDLDTAISLLTEDRRGTVAESPHVSRELPR